jgi:hypothetical protein
MKAAKSTLFCLFLVVVIGNQANASQEISEEKSSTQQRGGQDSSKSEGRIVIPDWRFSFELPSEKWKLFEKQESKDSRTPTMYMYKREALLDSQSRNVEPVIGVIFETILRDIDVVVYSANRRRGWNLLKLKLEKGFTHEDGLIRLKRAIGWVAKYERAGVEHTVKIVYAKDGEIGLQVIMDVTTDLFSAVESEFDYTLKSLNFIPEEKNK